MGDECNDLADNSQEVPVSERELTQMHYAHFQKGSWKTRSVNTPNEKIHLSHVSTVRKNFCLNEDPTMTSQ